VRERQARSRAEAAVRLRDEALAMVAHDLRNPLSAILAGTWALAEAGPDDKARPTYLRAVRQACEEMDRLIQDLLDVARSETGALTLRPTQVDVAVLIAQAIERFRPRAALRGQHLLSDIGTDLPRLRADPARLFQALANVVGNAVKFTHRGGRILLRAQRDGAAVRLSVTDDGPGIAPEHLPRIFDRFWQARRGGRSGAGLGLAIAKAIVGAHGGEIWVESAPGNGATFHMRLPAEAASGTSWPADGGGPRARP